METRVDVVFGEMSIRVSTTGPVVARGGHAGVVLAVGTSPIFDAADACYVDPAVGNDPSGPTTLRDWPG